MKKVLLLFAIVLFIGTEVQAQSPSKGFSFQGYARDYEGAALSAQSVTARVSVFPFGSSTEFEEIHTVTTDAYGIFHIVIGSLKPTEFGNLNFNKKNYWIKVEIKAFNSDFIEISNTELLSVPYAKAATTAANGVPPGTILPFGGTKANIPAGYLACDGTEINKTNYPDLFAAIEYAWGGSGSTFRVPDLRGYFLRGLSNGSGVDPDAGSRSAKYAGGNAGDNVGSIQHDGNKSHNHNVSDSGHNHGINDPGHSHGIDLDDTSGGGGIDDAGESGEGGTSTDNSTTGVSVKNASSGVSINNSGGNESRPENAAVWYIIKY